VSRRSDFVNGCTGLGLAAVLRAASDTPRTLVQRYRWAERPRSARRQRTVASAASIQEAIIATSPAESHEPTAAESVDSLGLTRRDRLLGAAMLLGVAVVVVALIVAFWRPAPPDEVVMSSGADGGAYDAFAKRYREILARDGVELVLQPSAGALENLDRLRDPHSKVDVALVQGGLARRGDETQLVTLGAVAYEALWFFHRTSIPLDRLDALRGRRIAAGQAGSGTRRMMAVLLEHLGMPEIASQSVPLGGMQAAEALERGEVDVAFLVSAADAAPVQRLLRADGVSLMTFARPDAYVRQIPALTRLELPEGAVDLRRNIPAQSMTLLAVKAHLVAKKDIHPVLVDLLLGAAREVHGPGGLLSRPGEFPAADADEFPLAADAERFYKTGPSSLRTYLPYWAVAWIQRLVFFGLPVVLVGIPLLRTVPVLYSWAVRRRIYRWYGELAFIERAAASGRGSRDVQLRRLDQIESRINALRVPASYAGEAYTLRLHLQMVRDRLGKR
jgi:TRAP-type uncharacterized transport system substrate-binding protein